MKKIIFILTFLVVLPLVAQKTKATLHFKDGTELKGLAKIVLKVFPLKIKFRKKKGEEIQYFDDNTLTSLTIRKGDRDIEYKYSTIEGRKNLILLEVIEEGKVTLLTKLVTAGSAQGGARIDYYVSKNNGNTVFHLSSRGSLYSKKSKIFNFKKETSAYFKDCPELVAKIQNKEFKKRNIVDIVEFYNENCN